MTRVLGFDHDYFIDALRSFLGKPPLPDEPHVPITAPLRHCLDGMRHLTVEEWRVELRCSRAAVFYRIERMRQAQETGVPYVLKPRRRRHRMRQFEALNGS